MEGGGFEGVVDEGVLLEKSLWKSRNLSLLDFAVPLLKDVDKEVELVVRREEGVGVELCQLKPRVLFAHKQLCNIALDCLLGSF